MKHIFLLILIISLPLSVSFSQELIYDVTIEERPVGNMLVSKIAMDSGRVYYSATLDLAYKLFRTTEMVQLSEAIYQNDTLRQAYFVDKRNGEVIEESKIEQLQDRKYYTTLKDEQKGWHEKPVTNSFLKSYYQKPQKRDSVFSEAKHQYVRVAKLPEEERYMFLNSEGEKDILEYNEEGICEKRSFHVGAVQYIIKLRKGKD